MSNPTNNRYLSDSSDISYGSEGGLTKGTSWWGAFVMGLAGTILVTGAAPVIVTTFGASYVPIIVAFAVIGWILCLLLAELSGMMPDRTGGSPTYAGPAFRKWPRLAEHVNGATAWMYWLGWTPVAPLNMILASFYIGSMLGLDMQSGFTPIGTFVSWWTVIIALIGIGVLGFAAYMGIKFGTAVATVLAVLSMIPLTFLSVAWIFRPSAANWNELWNFQQLDGSSFFSPLMGHPAWMVYLAFAFPLTWTVIAMEAAACYIGECRNPDRDAKVAMTLEGGYGVFVYTFLPISFIVVLGASELTNPDLVDPKTIFVTFASEIFPGAAGQLLQYLIGTMLIIALALSGLNALMGCSRSLYQISSDGQLPRWWQHLNRHGVPDHAMFTNVGLSILCVFMGGATSIYAFSNVGYLGSFVPVLIGFYLMRRYYPNARRPFRLPEFSKYVALAMAALFFVVWLVGGILYANIGGNGIYYFLGWGIALLYLPLYWFRTRVEDRRIRAKATSAPDFHENEVTARSGFAAMSEAGRERSGGR